MWALLPRSVQVIIIVMIGVFGSGAVSAVYAWFSDDPISSYKAASFVASAVIPVLVLTGEKTWRLLWKKFPYLNKIVFPDLNGTWAGTLKSTWINPETGHPPPPIPTTFWIRQGLFSISVRIKTGESRSHSTRCFVEADRPAQKFRIWYSYENEPNAAVTHRSTRHEGVAWLEIIDGIENNESLTGQYFTHRKTNGDIELKKESRDIQ